MAKSRETENQIVKPNQELPAYLRSKEVKGLETARDYIVLQRVKTLQKSSGNDLLQKFPMGTVMLVPSLSEVAPMEIVNNKPGNNSAPFHFFPLFFFAAWGRLNPMELKGKEPLFFDYTTDPESDIAKKSKSKATREENHPRLANVRIKNVELLNFVVILDDDRYRDIPVIVTFAKGEWMTGSSFLSKIKGTNASIFARRWEGRSSMRSRNTWDWFGIDVVEPQSGPIWATEDQYNAFEKLNEKLTKEHKTQGLRADDLESEATPDPETPAEKPKY